MRVEAGEVGGDRGRRGVVTAEVLLLCVGAFAGWWAGRWWSEVARGRFDARRAWRGRKDYRKRK
jgi:hypothetical protein